MLEQGFLQECVTLVRAGQLRLGPSQGPASQGGERTAERAIGYRQALDMLWKWKVALRDAPETLTPQLQDTMVVDFIREFQSASRQFVKRQLSWFRSDPTFRWINAEDTLAAQQSVLSQVEMEEDSFHQLYTNDHQTREQQEARASESSKEEQNALKRYQTQLHIYSSPDRRASLVEAIHAAVLSLDD